MLRAAAATPKDTARLTTLGALTTDQSTLGKIERALRKVIDTGQYTPLADCPRGQVPQELTASRKAFIRLMGSPDPETQGNSSTIRTDVPFIWFEHGSHCKEVFVEIPRHGVATWIKLQTSAVDQETARFLDELFAQKPSFAFGDQIVNFASGGWRQALASLTWKSQRRFDPIW